MKHSKKIIHYDHHLVEKARQLRKNAIYSEKVMWKYLKRKQVLGYDFDRQKPIDKYIVDFFCNELMLAIEIDGISHLYKEEYDQFRQNRLEELGITVLRFNGNDVIKNPEGVLESIVYWIKNQHVPTPNPSQEGK